MHISDFDYDLPRELIAQYPTDVRGESRLLVVHRKDGRIEHRSFGDITRYLSAGDALILNDTKVVPCRLIGKRATGGKVEVLLLKELEPAVFAAFLKPGRLKTGEIISFAKGLTGQIQGRDIIRFDKPDRGAIYGSGVMPLPPYIKRAVQQLDEERYQTVYAAHPGAVAAPTAGLHFTASMLGTVRSLGVAVGNVTLHTGPGTFKPIQCARLDEHTMDAEDYSIPGSTIDLIGRTRRDGGRVVAVGTTTVRALETYGTTGRAAGETTLFIRPGYRFCLCDALLTNFHLPHTTLLVLVHAFTAGSPGCSGLVREAYAQAVRNKYRFYSYGDAMLIL